MFENGRCKIAEYCRSMYWIQWTDTTRRFSSGQSIPMQQQQTPTSIQQYQQCNP